MLSPPSDSVWSVSLQNACQNLVDGVISPFYSEPCELACTSSSCAKTNRIQSIDEQDLGDWLCAFPDACQTSHGRHERRSFLRATVIELGLSDVHISQRRARLVLRRNVEWPNRFTVGRQVG